MRYAAQQSHWSEHGWAASVANAGDQVPPGADEQRIALMRDLVETHGRF